MYWPLLRSVGEGDLCERQMHAKYEITTVDPGYTRRGPTVGEPTAKDRTTCHCSIALIVAELIKTRTMRKG
jgi:hypothetical protein